MTLANGLDLLVLSDKDKKQQVPSHSNFTDLLLVDCKRTHTTVRKEEGTQTPVAWPTFPGLGGLSLRRDLNIWITS